MRPDADLVRQLAALLDASRRPVLVAGGGVMHSDGGAALLALAEKIDAAVVTTITGQGAVPDEHPLALGVIGDNGFHPHAARAVEESDLLVYL
ncbi:hypothetical protein ACWJV6_20955, partial [Clostridioides difficile]